jgi:hypothetical protein
MRELAAERRHGYLAARGMSTAEVDALARYHAGLARTAPSAVVRADASAYERMLGAMVARRTTRGWYVARGGVRPARVRGRYGRR